jgi:hypothetical protein
MEDIPRGGVLSCTTRLISRVFKLRHTYRRANFAEEQALVWCTPGILRTTTIYAKVIVKRTEHRDAVMKLPGIGV